MFSFLKSSYQKVQTALTKTRSFLGTRLKSFKGKPWTDETWDELEQLLYEADLGSTCIEDLISFLKKELRFRGEVDIEEVLQKLKERALFLLEGAEGEALSWKHTPLVILIVGINGSGKTTTIAKLSNHFDREQKRVLIGAGDTFRAAAAHQLDLWAQKEKIDIIRSKSGADPSAVAFDTVQAAIARHHDTVLIDTAGRLHNKQDLMQELVKIQKTCKKLLSFAPQETWLVLDATTGQNALDQVRIFHRHLSLTGIILTKLDGTAKGGIVISIYREFKIPIRFLGVGEAADDLVPFDKNAYIETLFSRE